MKKLCYALACCVFLAQTSHAQDEEKGFKLQNLFTGGSISAGFSNKSFLLGASPMFGYSLTKWADAGIVVNYSYTSIRDYSQFDDKLRQHNYGGGAFVRLYPLNFLFAQAQFEHNVNSVNYIYPDGTKDKLGNYGSNSFLVGAGYSSGRDPYAKTPFFFMSLMVDLIGDENSPYVDVVYGPNNEPAIRRVPVIKAGIQVPLFQGRSGSYKSY